MRAVYWDKGMRYLERYGFIQGMGDWNFKISDVAQSPKCGF